MFKITKYKNFNSTLNIDKIVSFLENGDFKSAETKKLKNVNLFRAKINYEDRLIFSFFKHNKQNYILLLEMVLNHDYNKSQFMRGKKVELEDFVFEESEVDEVFYVNEQKEFRYLDKIIVFSDQQEDILKLPPPLLIIGSAGSGKTSVVIEKLKILEGKCLYISLSEHLVKNSQKICGEVGNIDFLSFQSFLNSIEKQSKTEMDFIAFKNWTYKNGLTDIDKYFEEFKGVLTASNENAYLSEDEYLAMGVKQSLFLKDERKKVYKIFERYVKFLETQNFYDSNIVIFNLFAKVKKTYDYIIIDEVQDFTNKEIYFILLSLKNANNFILSGDAHQIVYSNFFSWSNLKTMLFNEAKEQTYINEILNQNYRNSKNITKISNTLLKIKQLRFGSIDKESNYLIESISKNEGNIHFYKANPKNIKEINQETRKSMNFAVIVFDENEKIEAKKVFNTELTFTIREAKGLEYQNIILFNFITNHSEHFFDIVKDISKEDLERDLKYNRQKDKENRDLESYKITINSLYVALTRGIESLYVLESKNHKLLELLDIEEEDKKKIEVKDSTKEEWLEEARKLKELGKVEQAREIEKKELSTLEFYSKYIDELNNINDYEKGKLFKLAKKENNIQFIRLLANEFNFKNAKSHLQKYVDNIIKEKDLKLLLGLIKDGFDISQIDIISLIEKKYEISFIETLLKNGLNVNLRRNDETALMVASKDGNKEVIKVLLKYEVDINIQNKEGANSLMIALKNEDVEIVKLLIDNGANLDLTNKNGLTPLMIASLEGHDAIVKLLIENEADVNLQDTNGKTALIIASESGNKEIVKFLIESGADVDVLDKYKNNLKKSLRQELLDTIASSHDNQLLEFLDSIKNGNIDYENDYGVTALLWASGQGYTKTVRLLVENGANVDLQGNFNYSALMVASLSGKKEIVKYLIENKANLSLIGSDGQTALTLADETGNKAIVKLLEENGANEIIINTKDFIGAIEKNNLEKATKYIQDGIDINIRNSEGRTALFIASEFGNKEIVELLLANGADSNIKTYGVEGTPLGIATVYGYIEIIKLLIEYGANVNLKTNMFGSTALATAYGNNNQEIIKLLKENGAE